MRMKYLKSFVPISLSDMVMALGDPLIALTLASLSGGTTFLAAFGVGKAIAVFFESPIIAILHASNVMTKSEKASRALLRFVLVFGAFLSLGLAFIGSESRFIRLFSSQLPGNTVDMVSVFTLSLAAWPILIAVRRFWQGRLIATGQSRLVASGSLLRLVLMALALGVLQTNLQEGHIIAAVSMMIGLIGETAMMVFYGQRLIPVSSASEAEQKRNYQTSEQGLPDSFLGVFRYYRPLAISMISLWGSRLGITLMIAAAGQIAVASWAAGWALVVSISNGVRMLQQVTIRFHHQDEGSTLFKFSFMIGLVFSGLLLALGGTQFGIALLELYAGSVELLREGIVNIVLWTSPLPMLMALQNYFQGILMVQNKTRQIGTLSLVFNGILLVSAAAVTVTNSLSVVSLSQILVSASLLEVGALFFFARGMCFPRLCLGQKNTLKEAL